MFWLMLPLVAVVAACALAEGDMIRGPKGSMALAAHKKAKRAYHADPKNNPHPADTIGLPRNMGYDVIDGKVGPPRPRNESRRKDLQTDFDPDDLDWEPELEDEGVSYSRSVSFSVKKDGVPRVTKRIFEVFSRDPKEGTFCLPTVKQGCGLVRAASAAKKQPSIGATNLLGFTVGIALMMGGSLGRKGKAKSARSSNRDCVAHAHPAPPQMLLQPSDSAYEKLPHLSLLLENFMA